MIKYIILISFYVLPSICIGQSWNDYDTIKGPVATVREECIFLDTNYQNLKLFPSEGDYGHNGFLSRTYTQNRFGQWWYNTYWVHYINYFQQYDKNHHILDETWFYRNGDTARSYKFTYAFGGQLAEEKESWSRDFTPFITAYNYNYDSTKLLSVLRYKPLNIFVSKRGNDTSTAHYEITSNVYDKQGDIIKEISLEEDGPRAMNVYHYDDMHHMVRKFSASNITVVHINGRDTVFKKNDIPELQEDRKYNTKGKLIEINQYGRWDLEPLKTIFHSEISYDAQGNKIEEMNNETKIQYQYYKNGSLKKRSQYFINRKDSSIVIAFELEYSYDQQGKPVKLIYFENKVYTEVVFKYKYDSHGNWTDQIKSVNGQERYRRKRIITYY